MFVLEILAGIVIWPFKTFPKLALVSAGFILGTVIGATAMHAMFAAAINQVEVVVFGHSGVSVPHVPNIPIPKTTVTVTGH